MRNIKTKEEALDLADKIAKYALGADFKAFSYEFDFEKKRSTPQNSYYWGVVVEEQYNYFSGNLVKFIEWIFKVVRFSLTREIIHEINKILYNGGKSSTKLKINSFVENFANPIREDMLHFCGLDIPLPTDAGLLAAYEEYLSRYGESNVITQ